MNYRKTPDGPVELAVVNCDSASPVPAKHVRSVLLRAARGSDVILGCECFAIKARQVLPEFHVVQFGLVDSPQAGSIVAVRRDRGFVHDKKIILGAAGLIKADVRARYWVWTQLCIDRMAPRPFSAGHAQPKRAWELWNGYMARAPRGVLGLDTNKLKRAVKVRFPMRKVRQIGLMAAVIPHNIPCGPAREEEVGGDHMLLRVTLWPDAG